MKAKDRFENLVALVRRMFEGISAELGDRATLRSFVDPRVRAPAFELRSPRQGTAEVLAYVVHDGQVDVFFGSSGRAEMVSRPGNSEELVHQVRELVEAVVGGKAHLTEWRVRGRTLRSRADWVTRDGRRRSSVSGSLLGFLIPGRRMVVRYIAY